ncbi:MAG: HAMP domain-containing protein [Planctomycetaceae bacterium]|nr:HAMP domain-containing protein [Planctomycetaceae bacterium]
MSTEFPDTVVGDEALFRFRNSQPQEDEYFAIRRNETSGSRELLYYYAIRPEASCLQCHAAEVENLAKLELEARKNSASGDDPTLEQTETADRVPLMAMARIIAPLDSMEAQLSRNRAVLLAAGIVTSFLAMMAAYAIVRYIIVKPVLHLKDVSDEIARGNLNQRAEINTGDEFEELGHAFNRMLRHMMTVNDELRGLNLNLDGKVDQLARANMELFNNNKLKDDFLATMSHELRTPLNSILGFSDILQGAQNLDERQKRYVKNIQTSGQSLMVQINDLLDLAKIESGKMELHLDRLAIADIIDQQVQQCSPLADRKNIDLRIDAPPTPPPLLHQDRGKISQILNNLLSNAIKFTPEGGRVRVVYRQIAEGMIEFSVEDTGIGIPLDEQEHIFEKFRQGSTAPGGRDHVKREFEGTGLGLSIVRELSRLLGGDVSLQSEFGKGSLFAVHLPISAPMKGRDTAVPLESRTSSGLGRITSVDLMNTNAAAPLQTTDTQLTDGRPASE